MMTGPRFPAAEAIEHRGRRRASAVSAVELLGAEVIIAGISISTSMITPGVMAFTDLKAWL